MTEIRHVTIPAKDGYKLAATLFGPDKRQDCQVAVIIASAMGVKRGFYHKYASYLASKGFYVLTFDYRGIGDSRPQILNKFTAQLCDWGELDIAGAIDWVTEITTVRRVTLVGHSVGGQVIGLAENNDRIAAMLLVASQSGYWALWPLPMRFFIAIFWYLALPAATILFSYFPAWLFGMGENLPAGVALEWASWGRKPGYLLGQKELTAKRNFTKFSAPILSYSIAGDILAPVLAVDVLLQFYPNAKTTRKHLTSAALKSGRIGHFGFFKARFEQTLWAESADWLLEQNTSGLESADHTAKQSKSVNH